MAFHKDYIDLHEFMNGLTKRALVEFHQAVYEVNPKKKKTVTERLTNQIDILFGLWEDDTGAVRINRVPCAVF